MSDPSGALAAKKAAGVAGLCASCDRCRARKTKCDGNRPCGNCSSKYMKKFKLTSLEGVDPALLGCEYSPAKRRGPVPGKAGAARKASEALAVQHEAHAQLSQLAPHHPGQYGGGMMGVGGAAAGGLDGGLGGAGLGGYGGASGGMVDDMAELQRQLQLQQQLEQEMAQMGTNQ